MVTFQFYRHKMERSPVNTHVEMREELVLDCVHPSSPIPLPGHLGRGREKEGIKGGKRVRGREGWSMGRNIAHSKLR